MLGGLSPLGSHSEKEGIGCALTDTNDAARGAGIEPLPLGAKLQRASTGTVPVLHNINSCSSRLGWGESESETLAGINDARGGCFPLDQRMLCLEIPKMQQL